MQEICEETTYAIVGTISAVSTAMDSSGVVRSTVTVNVERVIKGEPGSSLSFSTLGGDMEGARHMVGGVPIFGVGQRFGLMLADTGAGDLVVKLDGAAAVRLEPDANLPPESFLRARWDEVCGG